ncbi:hypothetical protein CK203_016672 [Vitis vinifera]|uniref:Uncharacterized protein n=1 Tax=Vitis vinifera TaxID=29760 RepID=A0A438J202_VITVI|nr:hypothetical protein CK203_016672 [Vitis vinifera]
MGSGHDHHLPQESLQIKEEGRLFSRLLSKESSMANSSYRVLYYAGASGAVPFMWEIQPEVHAKAFKTRLFVRPRLSLRKALASPSSSSSSSSSWSSMASSNPSRSTNSVLKSNFHGGCCFLGRPKSGLHFGVDDDDDHVFHSPTSTLQFGVRSGAASRFSGKIKPRYCLEN